MSIKIKKTEFKELYNIACTDWQTKFRNKFNSSIFEEELEFTEDFLQEMQNACNDKQLKVFNKIFKSFIKEDLYKVSSFSKICEKLGVIEWSIEDFTFLPEEMITPQFNLYRLSILTTFFNRGVKVDFSNRNQRKYYNYWELKDGKCGLCGVISICDYSDLPFSCYFLDVKAAKYCAEKFYNICTGIL